MAISVAKQYYSELNSIADPLRILQSIEYSNQDQMELGINTIDEVIIFMHTDISHFSFILVNVPVFVPVMKYYIRLEAILLKNNNTKNDVLRNSFLCSSVYIVHNILF